MVAVERVGAKDVIGLPRWARVAFAARCARYATQLVTEERPGAGRLTKAVSDKAVRLAEESAAAARPAAGVRDAYWVAQRLAGWFGVWDLSDDGSGYRRRPDGVDAARGFAIAAAAAAACSAWGDGLDETLAALDWAVLAARQLAHVDVEVRLRLEFDALRHTATEQGWTDETPIALAAANGFVSALARTVNGAA
jgi:hypothetical protein